MAICKEVHDDRVYDYTYKVDPAMHTIRIGNQTMTERDLEKMHLMLEFFDYLCVTDPDMQRYLNAFCALRRIGVGK